MSDNAISNNKESAKQNTDIFKIFKALRTKYNDEITKYLIANENLPFSQIQDSYEEILHEKNTIFTYLPSYSLENPHYINSIIKNITVPNGRHYALKIPAEFEYKNNDIFYVSSLKKIIEGSKRLRIIASNSPEYGLLYNDPRLIDLVIEQLKRPDFTKLQIALLQPLKAGETPDNFLKKLKEHFPDKTTFDDKIEIYKLYEHKEFIAELEVNNYSILEQPRVIESDKGCKITLRSQGNDKCTVFLYRESRYSLSDSRDTVKYKDKDDDEKEKTAVITLDKKIIQHINEVKEKVNTWCDEIGGKTIDDGLLGIIFADLKYKIDDNTKKLIVRDPTFKLDLFAEGKNTKVRFGNATEQITQAIDDLGEEMKGVCEEMKDLPRKIAEALSPTFQQIASILAKLESRENSNGG
jgi:hypothetical protein